MKSAKAQLYNNCDEMQLTVCCATAVQLSARVLTVIAATAVLTVIAAVTYS
jgi:hypothetical protein